jgi:hypothetical protein
VSIPIPISHDILLSPTDTASSANDDVESGISTHYGSEPQSEEPVVECKYPIAVAEYHPEVEQRASLVTIVQEPVMEEILPETAPAPVDDGWSFAVPVPAPNKKKKGKKGKGISTYEPELEPEPVPVPAPEPEPEPEPVRFRWS